VKSARLLQEERGFDLALSTRNRTGGEDLAALFQMIMHRNRLVYEPASLAYHELRRAYSILCKQIYYYVVVLTIYPSAPRPLHHIEPSTHKKSVGIHSFYFRAGQTREERYALETIS
jgi:hypothetical protein